MSKERALTYSLLAHIRNNGTLVSGPIDIFVPLIKRTLTKMNSNSVYEGKSLLEIKKIADSDYFLDFPVPVLNKILTAIEKETKKDNTKSLILYQDGAFRIDKYAFADFDDIIEKQKLEIDEIERLFTDFCKGLDYKNKNSNSIFNFIEQNKSSLSQYISNRESNCMNDYTIEAQFVAFFKKIPSIYERIKDIYLGSIISNYIHYKPNKARRNVELLLDTNFITGLLDLNTEESTHTCKTLLNIAQKQDFKISILEETINEIVHLLENKAKNFDTSFLLKKVKKEDIYNACDRRNLNQADLERIKDNIHSTLLELNVKIIKQTGKLESEAKKTKEYERLKEVRKSNISALHDAVAILYVTKARKRKIKNFGDVNCWFVNNSILTSKNSLYRNSESQPEKIRADDLLNILWLSNPQMNDIVKSGDLVEIGIASSMAFAIRSGLPKARILRELDDNIHKYAKERISDTDIVRISTRITNKQFQDIEKLNKVAHQDKDEFIKRLESEADKQKQFEEKQDIMFKDLYDKFVIKSNDLDKKKNEYTNKIINIESEKSESKNDSLEQRENSDRKICELEDKLLEKENMEREVKRNDWVDLQVKKWRKKTRTFLFVGVSISIIVSIIILFNSKWSVDAVWVSFKKLNGFLQIIIPSFIGIIITFFIKCFYGKYGNHSNIESYKKSLEIPTEFKSLKK